MYYIKSNDVLYHILFNWTCIPRYKYYNTYNYILCTISKVMMCYITLYLTEHVYLDISTIILIIIDYVLYQK